MGQFPLRVSPDVPQAGALCSFCLSAWSFLPRRSSPERTSAHLQVFKFPFWWWSLKREAVKSRIRRVSTEDWQLTGMLRAGTSSLGSVFSCSYKGLRSLCTSSWLTLQETGSSHTFTHHSCSPRRKEHTFPRQGGELLWGLPRAHSHGHQSQHPMPDFHVPCFLWPWLFVSSRIWLPDLSTSCWGILNRVINFLTLQKSFSFVFCSFIVV